MSSMLVSAGHELVFVDVVKGMPVLLVVSELRFQLVTMSINWWKKSTIWKKTFQSVVVPSGICSTAFIQTRTHDC